jgi:hypothetical protein
MSIAVIAVECVLSEHQDLHTSPPTKWGKPLYEALRSQFRMTCLTSNPRDLAEYWMRREGITGRSGLLAWPDQGKAHALTQWKFLQVKDFLAEGWEIAFYVDADPLAIKAASELGVRTLLVSYPPIGFHADYGGPPRAWDEVVEAIEKGA